MRQNKAPKTGKEANYLKIDEDHFSSTNERSTRHNEACTTGVEKTNYLKKECDHIRITKKSGYEA